MLYVSDKAYLVQFLHRIMKRIIAGIIPVIFFLPAAAQLKINGKIIDCETRQPVPFATIAIVGTNQGTSSNTDGEFSLLIPDNGALRISSVGYVTAIITDPAKMTFIELTPFTSELNEILVLGRRVNPRYVVRRALGSIRKNYPQESFMQRFFYRHYCKDDSTYGRLIEAFVDVWKHQGYRQFRKTGGEREEIRITHLRRSLDNTVLAAGHPPISVDNVLQADVAGYQAREPGLIRNFYTEASTLRMDFDRYEFSFGGVTRFEDQQAYVISYQSLPDSLLTSAGYIPATSVSGVLYITTDDFAIVKYEETRQEGNNTSRSSAHYKKQGVWYYPAHLLRESEIMLADGTRHYVHIEMVLIDIITNESEKFTGHPLTHAALLNIPMDTSFWNHAPILKATPLEDAIVRDIGRDLSLNQQFDLYRKYVWSTTEGGRMAEEKFSWYREYSRGKRLLFLIFWDSRCNAACLIHLEHAKQLQKNYRKNLSVVLLSLDDDEDRWVHMLNKYSLFADGMINYRIGSTSELKRSFLIKEIPAFFLLAKDGYVHRLTAYPGDPNLEMEIRALLQQ